MAARSLEGRLIGGRPIAVRVFPVETRNIGERLQRAIDEEGPEAVLLLGQAGGRASISIERVAVNVLDFDQPDNVGVMRKNDLILRGGPEARISAFPLTEIVAAWTENGIPGYISNAAGTFIGNQALYELIGIGESAAPPVLGGLVHLPYLPAQAAAAGAESTPSMAFDLMKRALEVVIETLVPWLEQRLPERVTLRPSRGPQLWIPRGVKEVER